MGKKLRQKEAQRRAAEQKVVARLLEHSRNSAPAAPAASHADLPAEMRAAIERFRHRAVRPVGEWRATIRSRSPERRFIELVRYAFARYPVPRHLEASWLGEPAYEIVDAVRRRRAAGPGFVPSDLRAWYILVAQGGSLHREVTGAFFTKAETHHFLTAPPEAGASAHAFWYALARAQGADRARAVALAGTKLADYSIGSTFWRDAARYFVRHPLSVSQVNDLVDYLAAAREEDGRFSLKGRSPEALRRRMEAWHRALRKARTVCGGIWTGAPLPDATYETGSEARRAIWRFRQIKTGNDLFREGQRMHHCVVTYKGRCMSGEVSIWSLTSEFPLGQHNRGVTLEVTRAGAIAQARGFANRLPHANEEAMIRRWAIDNRLDWLRC